MVLLSLLASQNICVPDWLLSCAHFCGDVISWCFNSPDADRTALGVIFALNIDRNYDRIKGVGNEPVAAENEDVLSRLASIEDALEKIGVQTSVKARSGAKRKSSKKSVSYFPRYQERKLEWRYRFIPRH